MTLKVFFAFVVALAASCSSEKDEKNYDTIRSSSSSYKPKSPDLSRYSDIMLCKAAIAESVGRPTISMTASTRGLVVSIQYTRESDSKNFSHECKREKSRLYTRFEGWTEWPDKKDHDKIYFEINSDQSLSIIRVLWDGSTMTKKFGIDELNS